MDSAAKAVAFRKSPDTTLSGAGLHDGVPRRIPAAYLKENVMNALNWFEIPVTDFTRACRFYEAILAAALPVDDSFPGMQMAFLPSSETGVGGCLVACDASKPNADGVRVYLNGGEDLAAILARIQGAGGKVVVPKTLIREDIGYFALFEDSEGNVLGLHSMR